MINTFAFDTYQEENYMPSWYRLERYDFCEHILGERSQSKAVRFISNLFHKFF